MRALRAPVGELHGPEQLLLERVGRGLVEQFVGTAERCERDGDLVDRLGDRVEQLLPGLGSAVGHASVRAVSSGEMATRPHPPMPAACASSAPAARSAMDGAGGATPALDAAALVESVPGLRAFEGLEAQTVANVPSAHLTLAKQLEICREARDAARRGIGVVVTHGTDTLEETAMLCDIINDAEAPIVFTGAIRPATRPAPTAPRTSSTRSASRRAMAPTGLGVLVVFGGEIHHARVVRKTDTTSLTAFSSPQIGPLGRVTEGHPSIWSRIRATRTLDPPHLDKRVFIVPTAAGDDGSLARAALDTDPDGVVIGTLGAGHMTPELLELWAEAADRIPVVAYCRPERGVILNSTYGYAAPSMDLRAARDHPGRLPLAAGRAHEAARLPRLGPLDRRGPLGVQPGRRLSPRPALFEARAADGTWRGRNQGVRWE